MRQTRYDSRRPAHPATGGTALGRDRATDAFLTLIVTICLILSAGMAVLLRPPPPAVAPVLPRIAVPSVVATMETGQGAETSAAERGDAPWSTSAPLTRLGIPADIATSAAATARYVAARPALARQFVARQPRSSAGATPEGQLAAAIGAAASRHTDRGDARLASVHAMFAALPQGDSDWLAVLFPGVVGNLPGAPFPQRILANRIRVAAALADARAEPPAPPAPRWRHWWPMNLVKPQAPLRDRQITTYREILASHRRLVYFDPAAAGGRGAWAELVGDLGPRTTAVGLLVPGGSAHLTSDNFDRYESRAANFVAAAHGALAMVVWAGGDFPSGWVKESMARYDAPLARSLAAFSYQLRYAVADAGGSAAVTAIGHSYGGAVVGEAELYGLSVDRVLQVASAGTGAGVRSTADYPVPNRPRYAMTGPGDWISYVQGLSGPVGLGIGHGSDPDTTPGFTELATGSLPANPHSPDEFGRPVGHLAGTAIAGRGAHSMIFIPRSGAWWNMYHVMVGGPLHTLPQPHQYTASPAPVNRLPFAPLAGSMARSCHYTRRPGGPRFRPVREDPVP